MSTELSYLAGFGNEFSTEALPGALPEGQNSPLKCPYDLYAEQLSGTAFTMSRGQNQRSWLYRIMPSVAHEPFTLWKENSNLVSDFTSVDGDPNQLRWNPMPMADDREVNFIEGLLTVAGSGSAATKTGVAIHMYAANTSMADTAMFNSDGDFLIVPQAGALHVRTEFGRLDVAPREICVIPRGIKFSVDLSGPARGYVLEAFRGHFALPGLGPIGANGLANPRDFLYPVAAFDDGPARPHRLVNKFLGRLYCAPLEASPFDVVAWSGNYAPYKYDLTRFCAINTVSFDHPDPSVGTVLTVPSDTPGEAAADFAIFPPRWMVAEHTFRPPYFHRNCMSEFMGMIYGSYDAKKGFLAGGSSLHTCMTPHGPDAATVEAAWGAGHAPGPAYFDGGLAFMFETSAVLKVTPAALGAAWRDGEYAQCWKGLRRLFRGPSGPPSAGSAGGCDGEGEYAAAATATTKPAATMGPAPACSDRPRT